ncbi:H2A histone family member X [Mycena olivaceomarginata]|nr:H2A histone family member X [Mycena olivaceomarginata]
MKEDLVFPTARIKRRLNKRVSVKASVYVAAVLEYLVTEIVELAGDVTHEHNKKRITPRYLSLAIQNDEEFSQLLKGVIIPQGGR